MNGIGRERSKNNFCILAFAESIRTRVETGEVMSKFMLGGVGRTRRASKAPLRTAKTPKIVTNVADAGAIQIVRICKKKF